MSNRSRKCSRFLLDFIANLLPVIKQRKYLYCFVWFLLYHLLHLSAQIALELSQVYSHTIFFVLNIWIFKNYPQKIVSCNVNLSNLGNVLQRHLRANRTRECIFRASGGIHFEKLTALRQPWCCLHGFKVCTRLPKKTLDTSLNSNRWLIENL